MSVTKYVQKCLRNRDLNKKKKWAKSQAIKAQKSSKDDFIRGIW